MTPRSRTEACRSGMLPHRRSRWSRKPWMRWHFAHARPVVCTCQRRRPARRSGIPRRRCVRQPHRDKYCRAEHQRWRLGRDLPRRACAPIAGGPGQSMPKLTCAPRKLAWAPMARNVVWLVPSCLQRLSTRVGGPVKLVAGKLIYTAWVSNSPSAARIFGDSWRRETGLAQHMREQSASAVAADRDAKRRSTRWQQKL
jgi:hypothetical protein